MFERSPPGQRRPLRQWIREVLEAWREARSRAARNRAEASVSHGYRDIGALREQVYFKTKLDSG